MPPCLCTVTHIQRLEPSITLPKMEQWDFEDDGDGRWFWRYFSPEEMRESVQDFSTRTDCIADAMGHGYLALDLGGALREK